MLPGERNRQITIQKKIAGEWTDFCTVWAKRNAHRGRKRFLAATDYSELTVVYEISFRRGILPNMRLIDKTDNNREYKIHFVDDDPWNNRSETHIEAKELADG